MNRGRYAHRSRGTIFGMRASRQMIDASIALVCLLLLAFGGMAAVDVTKSGDVANSVTSAVSSSPPDQTLYVQEGAPARSVARAALASTGVFVNDPSLAAGAASGTEPSIAVNPANPLEIAITRGFGWWNGGNNARLLHSTDGGINWTDQATIPPPPGAAGTAGCPCDQTIDFGRDGRLYGTFLLCVSGPSGCTSTSVATGSTTNAAQAASWSWNGNPAQLTSGTRTNVDQPWLLVNRDPTNANQDNAYVAYDDFGGGPTARVAVSYGANPVNITADNQAGTASPLVTNPGFRLATNPINGTVYALYEQSTGATQPKSVTYRINRSTDGGATWTLNGNADGLVVDTVNSDQAPGFKFGGVNALLGGIDHAAVDPGNGDVYVVYGADVSGGNQIRIRRLQANGSGGLAVGGANNVSTSTDSAMPSVAVLANGTIGVLYDSFDGNTSTGVPTFSAHLARSTNHGTSFTDTVLQTFQSPALPDSTQARQRVLGDFQQIKAVGNSFFGVYSGNRNGFGSTTSVIDPIFFSVPQNTQTALSSSANPSVFGQPVNFAATVTPPPDGGTAAFTIDGNALGLPVPVNTTTGVASSDFTSTLSVGSHAIKATYSGNDNFTSSSATLTQVVGRAPVATTIGSAPNPSLFGEPVTFTDTVCAAPPSTGPPVPPSGSVVFRDGATLLGSRSLSPGGGAHCAQATLTTPNLLPGTHVITAKYDGDGNYLPAGLETLSPSQSVGCATTLTGDIRGSINTKGPSTCILNATVRGAVIADHGALFIGNSTVRGAVSASHTTFVGVCGTRIGGALTVERSSRFVVIGDPDDDGCATNSIAGAVVLSANQGGAELIGNLIGGAVVVSNTRGTGPFPEDVAAEIEANTIGGALSCNGNVPPPINDGRPNTVRGARAGQCRLL